MYCPHCVFNVLFKYVKYVSIQRKANLSSSGVIGRTFLMDTGTIGFLWGICGDCPILSVTWTAFSFLTPPSESQAPHPQRYWPGGSVYVGSATLSLLLECATASRMRNGHQTRNTSRFQRA